MKTLAKALSAAALAANCAASAMDALSVPLLATNGTSEASAALCEWYASLAGLPVPTMPGDADHAWLEEQARCLSAYSRFLVGARHTNAWLAAARRLGGLRDELPDMDGLRRRAMERISAGGTAEDIASARAWAFKEQDKAFALQRAEEVLADAVIDVFGRMGLPSLPEPQRSDMLEAMAREARLTESERLSLRSAASP